MNFWDTSTQLFRVDNISLFVALFIILFSLLTLIYSYPFMRSHKGIMRYYVYIILTSVTSLGAVFSNNLIVLMVFWGFLGLLLYLLIGTGTKERTPATAKKAFIIIGGTDAFMLLGLAFIWHLSGSFDIDKLSISLNNRLSVLAYLCLAIGAFAKAGVMPFHTWVPDMAEDAPTPVSAFLPASLDKLLGIYFLARISLDVFNMNAAMNTFLMVVGSITILAAVMMALVQHDLKRLLGYHAVSQVGYMVLGIGTGYPIGIAGGLFHMLNNAIYKSCLFFSGGAVEKKAGTTNLEKLGGFAKIMPITFTTFLIASFAISGVPPFNGFASKWMVYQGVIESSKSGGGHLWIVWLVAAMLGSGLTLASFMKLIHAVFLGQPAQDRSPASDKRQEAPVMMLIPTVTLATLCVLFGVFAYRLPLRMFILPSLNQKVTFLGFWSPNIATISLLAGLVIGWLIYLLGSAQKARETEIFVGGEILKDIPEMRLSGTEFYHTIQDIGFFKFMYRCAEKKLFDIYDVGTRLTFFFNRILRYLHNGVLPTYLSWCLLGMLILLLLLFR